MIASVTQVLLSMVFVMMVVRIRSTTIVCLARTAPIAALDSIFPRLPLLRRPVHRLQDGVRLLQCLDCFTGVRQ